MFERRMCAEMRLTQITSLNFSKLTKTTCNEKFHPYSNYRRTYNKVIEATKG